MKVLFTSLAHNTHFFQMVPIAWALRTAGHEVRVACHPELTDAITGTGLTAVPVECPSIVDMMGPFEWEAMAFHQTFDYTEGDGPEPTWEELLVQETIVVPALYSILNNDAMIDELARAARQWRPDLVVWESFSMAGAVVAQAIGAAHARVVSGTDLALQVQARRAFLRRKGEQAPEHREDPTAEWLNWTLERLGGDRRFDEEMLTGQWTINAALAEARTDHLGLTSLPVRYVPYNGRSVVPDWLHEPADRPRVCLTLGVSDTIDESEFDLNKTLDTVLRALADLDVEVVATLDEDQRAELRQLPANVRVVDFVPLNELLPTCAAIVHHGGYGTKSTAELHGVPQVIIVGFGWITEAMGAGFEERGTALAAPIRLLTVDGVRDMVTRVLTEPSFAENAARLRQEMLAQPSPNDIVPLLEKLTAERAAVPPDGD